MFDVSYRTTPGVKFGMLCVFQICTGLQLSFTNNFVLKAKRHAISLWVLCIVVKKFCVVRDLYAPNLNMHVISLRYIYRCIAATAGCNLMSPG